MTVQKWTLLRLLVMQPTLVTLDIPQYRDLWTLPGVQPYWLSSEHSSVTTAQASAV